MSYVLQSGCILFEIMLQYVLSRLQAATTYEKVAKCSDHEIKTGDLFRVAEFNNYEEHRLRNSAQAEKNGS